MPDEKQLATIALQFLNRVQLSPPEIDAFMAVTQWLRTTAGIVGQVPPQPKEG